MEDRGQSHGSKTPSCAIFLEKFYDALEKLPKYISHWGSEKDINMIIFYTKFQAAIWEIYIP